MSDPLKPTVDEDAPTIGAFDWIVAGTCLFVGGMMSYVVPTFYDIFRDFDTELPAATELLMRVPFYLWAVLGIAAAAVVILKARSLSSRVNSTANLITIGLAMAFFAFTVVALFGPLKALIENLSK